jgi:hypothetical protein
MQGSLTVCEGKSSLIHDPTCEKHALEKSHTRSLKTTKAHTNKCSLTKNVPQNIS